MTNETGVTTAMSSGRARADMIFAWVAALTVLAVVVQIFLAGVGVFGINAAKPKDASSFDPHRIFGDVIGVLALVMVILALVARVSKAAIWGSVVLLLLSEVAQRALASAGESNKWVGGLHAGDGALILVLVLWLTAQSHRRMAAAQR
jgi:hypothetical protein